LHRSLSADSRVHRIEVIENIEEIGARLKSQPLGDIRSCS